ncbi:MAG: hypothetical protein ABII06_12310 [Pseudomonadota bacterium]
MNRSDILFATPSFLGGLSSVLDLGSTLTQYNTAATPAKADANAIKSDWEAVGNDLRVAMDQYQKTRNDEEK